jgi:predicted glutamine amidotransferase
MCRMLGIVSSRRASLAELLGRELERFVELAGEHPDGWGMAYTRATDDLVLVKEPERPDRSPRFRPLVETRVTDAAILHLRLAGPRRAAVLGDTHPFCDGDSAFAHNGAFNPVHALDATLALRYLDQAEGGTDSERFHLAVRQRLDAAVEPAKALIQTAAEIRELAVGYDCLNSLLLTGDALYAYADHNPASPVLRRRGENFFDLLYRADQEKVVIGSTGWLQPTRPWTRLERGSVLRVDRHDLSITVTAA